MKILISIGAIWAFYKWYYAQRVIGKTISIRSIRKKTALNNFGKLELKIEYLNKGESNFFQMILVKIGRIYQKSEELWLYAPLEKEYEIAGKKYDYLLIMTKQADDNLNKKKEVACHIKAGYSLADYKDFVDFAAVKIIEDK